MVVFRYIEDIENWFAPMSYNDFWNQVTAFDVELPDKPKCDGKIISGQVNRDVILGGLKYLASTQLSVKLGLRRRPMEMPDQSRQA